MTKMNDMTLIASADLEWGIGMDGKLLFPIKRDMARFKELTTGNVIIMGRKTLDSLPDGKPLPDRINIVLTHDNDFAREGIIVCNSIDELSDTVNEYPDKRLFVIGGGEIYRLLLPYCSTAHITRVNAIKPADTHMANLDSDPNWILAEQSEEFTEHGISFTFCTYRRK